VADYTKPTGNYGTMMIRVNATTVQFYLKVASTTTYNHAMPYGWTVNGQTGSSTYDFTAGSTSYRLIRQFNVTTSQTVTFRLGDTNTSGLGGPTTLSVAVDRGSIPSPPSKVSLTNVKFTGLNWAFTDGANNGYAIDARQLGWGLSSTSVQFSSNIGSAKSGTLSGLAPGFRYYVWARTHNAKGWSAWGPVNSAVTLGPAFIYVAGQGWRRAIPYVRVAGVWKEAQPWVKKSGVWKVTSG